MTRVLIAVDGTEESVGVACTAQRLFGETAEYLILNVVETKVGWTAALEPGLVYPVPYRYPAAVDAAAMVPVAELDEAEDNVTHIAEESGLAGAESVVETGWPTDAILKAADEHHVDVIVVGSSSSGWFSRLLHGSVSEGVVRGADIPVLVAKARAG
jgi:nucleotide-binding universal stress UspA family protein